MTTYSLGIYFHGFWTPRLTLLLDNIYTGKSNMQKFLKSLGEIFMPVKTDTSFPKV